MNFGKKTLSIFTIVLILFLTASTLDIPLTVTADTTTTPTWSFISIGPNPVGLGQTANIRPSFIPFPPTAVDFGHNLKLTITAPDGTVTQAGPFTSDGNGAYNYYFVPTQVGNYTIKFNYPGETFTDANLTYLPSEATTTLTVQEQPIPGYSDFPWPTDSWTNPISADLRNWYNFSGDWLQGGYDAAGRIYGDSAGFNPYSQQSPTSAHVVWNKPVAEGGLIGGSYGTNDYYTGLQYDSLATPPIIINGRLYYRLFYSSSGSAGSYPGFACVDLRTGQEYWRNTTGNIDIGQVYLSQGLDGSGARAFLWDTTPANWTVYDAFSGIQLYTLTGGVKPSKVIFGPNGDIYGYVSGGTATKPWLAMWNSTKAWASYGFFSQNSLRSYRPGAYNWSAGIQWNVTVPSMAASGYGAPSVYAADPTSKTVILSTTPTADASGPLQIQYGYNALTGENLWISNFTWQGELNNRFSVGQGMLLQMNLANGQRAGIDMLTGKIDYWTDPTTLPWGMFSSYGINTAYGLAYIGGYDGYLRAFNLTTGKQAWAFYSGNSGTETPLGEYPMFNGPTVGGGIVYEGYSEHTPNSPLYRGAPTFAINATTGQQIWSINAWLSLRALADGYLVTVNMYDNQMYVLGKGPTATTVTAPQTFAPQGTGILVQGTITDQSPGQPGTPAISDTNMSAWMEHLKEQHPLNGSVTGVPVHLTAIDPNGNLQDIGTTISNDLGSYAITWTPPVSGMYMVTATFEGSNSYYSSSAATALAVSEPPTATPSSQQAQTQSMADLYLLPGFVGVIIAIIFVGAAIILLQRKRP